MDRTFPPLWLGTWQTGKTFWVGIEDAESERAIAGAIDLGITAIDTAAVYGEGHAEWIIGEAIKGQRDRVMLASKVFAHDLAPQKVKAACDRSLKNLQTDYLDLYQIHWPAGSWGSDPVPIGETMGALVALQRAGKIRAIGVSNFSLAQLQEAQKYGPIATVQPPYSLLWRQVEKDLILYCQRQHITVLAYSPLAQGLLTGKFGPNHQFAEGDHRSRHRLFTDPHLYAEVQHILGQLRAIAEDLGCSLAQLALAWVMHHPGVCAIAGARNLAQVEDNAAALKIHLDESTFAIMNHLSESLLNQLDDNPVQWHF